MCRVIMTGRADFNQYDKQYGVLKLMEHLEAECGGQGNGYALVRKGVIFESRKGVKLSNEEIYKRIITLKWDYLVYHTRICSIGAKGDANCHPFVQGNDCVAMNGTEHGLSTLSNALSRTDTEVIFKNITGMGLESTTRTLVELSSVFVGTADGKPYVVKAGGTLHKWKGGSKSFHASTFPIEVKNVADIKDGYMWLDGKEDLQFTKDRKGYGYGGYYNDNYYGRAGWGYYSGTSKAKTTTTKTTTPKVTVKAAETKPAKKDKSVVVTTSQTDEYTYQLGYDAGREDGYNEALDDYDTYPPTNISRPTSWDDCEYDIEAWEDGYTYGYQDGLSGVANDVDPDGTKGVRLGKVMKNSTAYKMGYEDGRNDADCEEKNDKLVVW